MNSLKTAGIIKSLPLPFTLHDTALRDFIEQVCFLLVGKAHRNSGRGTKTGMLGSG